MAVSGKFSCLDLISKAARESTEAKTTEYTEIWLNPLTVKESPQNTHKECKNIEQLADSFLLTGQEQPTVLARVNGEFRIVDGHRRNKANILLLEKGDKRFEKVRYFYKDMTETMYELSLLVGNGFTQDLTAYEKTELAARLKSALKKAKEAGEIELHGSLRALVGEIIGETSGQMGRMEKINNSLIEEAKEQFQAGNIGISAAYETARLPEEEQKKIAEQAATDKVEAKDIAAMVKERQQKAADEKKLNETVKRAEKAAKRAEDAQIGAAQASLQAERSAESADQSAGFAGMNPPELSESDIENEAVYTLQELIIQAKQITYNELLVLQDILMKCNNRE